MNRKNLISAAFFLLLLTATIVVIFQGNDMNTVVAAMQTLSPVYLVAAALTALFFTSAEGIMIWYLLDSLEGKPLFFPASNIRLWDFFIPVSHRLQQADSRCSFITCRKKGIKYRTAAWCL